MILAIDVGNTHTVIGLFDHDPNPIRHWRIQTDREQTGDEFYLFAQGLLERLGYGIRDVTEVVLGSVVPPLTSAILEAFPKTQLIDHTAKYPFTIDVPDPKTVGADRLINAHAAVIEHGTPLIIIDAGTATTFCAVTKDRRYIGGAIAPGVGLSAKALFKAAAKLPTVDLRSPGNVIGNSTETAIQSGILHGFAAMVDGMVERMTIAMGSGPCKVIATGGLIPSVQSLTKTTLIMDPDLTLKGLYYLCKKSS